MGNGDEQTTTVDRHRVAPGPGQRVASSSITLNVVVRDLMGRPMPDADVSLALEGRQLASAGNHRTDDQGLVTIEAPGNRLLQVTARKRVASDSPFGDRLRYDNATVDVTTAASDSDWVTVRMTPRYVLQRPHAWQNAAIRAHHYIDVRGSATDPGSVNDGNDSYAKTRNGRLQEAIEYLVDRLPESGPRSPSAPQLTDEQRARVLRNLDERERENEAALAAVPERPRWRHRRETARLNAEQAQIQSARSGVVAHQRHETLGAMTHRQLLTHLEEEVFQNDPQRELVPDWARYMLIHYTGFYYRAAHYSFCPSPELLNEIRRHEIESAEVVGNPSAEELEPLLSEFRALLRNQPDLADMIGGALSGRPRRRRRQRRRRRGAPEPEPEPTETDNQRHLHQKLDRAAHGGRRGTPAMRDILQAVAAVGARSAQGAVGLGMLVSRRDSPTPGHEFGDEDWAKVVRATLLRNDLADEAMVESWWSERRGDDTESSRNVRGSPLFPDRWMRSWADEQARSHEISVLSCVCNEVAEMAAQARGLNVGGQGMWGDAVQAQNLAARGAEEESDEPVPSAEAEAPPHPSLGHRLWRVTSLDQLAPGDIVFQMAFRTLRITNDADSVTIDLDMVYLDDTAHPIPLQLGAGASGSGMVGEQQLHREPTNNERSQYEALGRRVSGYQQSEESLNANQRRQVSRYNHLDPYMNQNGLQRSGSLVGARYAIARSNARHHHPMIVRKSHTEDGWAKKYDEVLEFSHMFTILYVDPASRRRRFALTYETHAPVGVKRRPLQGRREAARNYGMNAWRFVVARPADTTAPNLSRFLNMRQMLRALQD